MPETKQAQIMTANQVLLAGILRAVGVRFSTLHDHVFMLDSESGRMVDVTDYTVAQLYKWLAK